MNKRMLVSIILLLCACSMGSDRQRAEQALVKFFDHLAVGQYAQAAALYGGSYEELTYSNPELDPGDYAALWRNACQINGFQCLKVRSIRFIGEQNGNEFRFEIKFSTRNGELFVLGPCCGASEEEMPPVSQFTYRVKQQDNGNFLVLDVPVYVP